MRSGLHVFTPHCFESHQFINIRLSFEDDFFSLGLHLLFALSDVMQIPCRSAWIQMHAQRVASGVCLVLYASDDAFVV